MKTKCDLCGKIVEKTKTKLTRNKHNFCNKKCQLQWNELEKTKCRIAVICEQCGRAFSSLKIYYNRNNHHFCSKECYRKWYKYNTKKGENSPNYNTITTECDFCGKVVKKRPSEIRNNVTFCSPNCWYRYVRKNIHGENHFGWKQEKVACTNCDRIISRKPSAIADNVFCSRNCYDTWRTNNPLLCGENNPMWNGGVSFLPYGEGFSEELKQKVRERDNYHCRICDASEDDTRFNCHHIDFSKTNHFIDNLIYLCVSCHGLVHAKNIEKLTQKMLQIDYQIYLVLCLVDKTTSLSSFPEVQI